jgi:transposase-like protein
MENLPRQKYTKEFREQAVRLVSEQACATRDSRLAWGA